MEMTNKIDFPTLLQLPVALNALHLNGEQGTNREKQERCQIHATHDYEAIQCWLNEYRLKATTFRTYQKEAERLLLWAVYQRQKPLSSLDRDDLESYLNFLDNPEPRQIWCMQNQGRGRRRGDPGWRPFMGPLSHSAKQTAISCIESLFKYLVAARYLSFNPLILIRKSRAPKPNQATAFSLQERMLDIDEWHAMLDTLDHFPEKKITEKHEKERLRFIISALFFLGLRIEELATHTWGSFRKVEDQWWFMVIGKGDKPRTVPVCDELSRAIITYRSFLKKAPYPQADEKTPLITALMTHIAITPRQINKILKKLALATASRFDTQPERVRKLKRFSAHWLRHLSASMQDRAGIKFKHIKANHGHENDETTRGYVHTIDEDRHQDMQKLTLRIPS